MRQSSPAAGPATLPLRTGYAHPSYAAALAEHGRPMVLPRSGACVLRRPIPRSDQCDAMGCYPLFVCADWSRLGEDLADLSGEVVSLTVVTDPLSTVMEAELRTIFPDLARPFKDHFLVELEAAPESFVHSHHQRYVRYATKRVRIRPRENSADLARTWTGLYQQLIDRHGIQGIAAFSAESFARQLEVPGMVAFEAVQDTTSVGMTLYYVDGESAYYHLGACSPAGYEARAAYGLMWAAIVHFRSLGLRVLHLGAGAGAHATGDDGLTRYKSGWATGVRTAYLCGRIFDRDAYLRLCAERQLPPDGYFPAYRRGEFA